MNRKEPTSRVVIKFVIAIIIAIYILFPFALVVINSCKATADITSNPIGFNGVSIGQLISNLNDVVNNPNFLFWHAFGYSVLITIVSLILLAVFGAMTVFILTGFIKGIPYDLEEAASIDGCRPEQVFFKVIFPLLTPVITTVTILNGMWIWNDYLLPSMMLGQNGAVKTLPVAVQAFVGSYVKQWNLILTAAFLAIIPMVVLFLFAQKQIMNGMIEGAVKG